MSIKWQSLLTDQTDAIDYAKLGKLVSIVLALLGGLGLLTAMAVEIATKVDVPTGTILITCGVLIAPLTGGHIADGISGVLASRRVQAGVQVSRRASDQVTAPPEVTP